MPDSPDTKNFTLGKGIAYFNKKNANTGLYEGERDLGNAPSLTFNIALDKLEHFSSRGGIKAKDKEVISQITPAIKFTLDEINKQNLALLTLGDIIEVSQPAGENTQTVKSAAGLRVKLDHRNIGIKSLPINNVTGTLVPGEVITGGTSSATATVLEVGADYIYIEGEAGGPFSDSEVITGSTSSATADVNSATGAVFVSGRVVVSDVADSVFYANSTDFEVDSALKDDRIGRVLTSSGTTIPAGDVHVHYAYDTVNYSELRAITNTILEGSFRYVSDNPSGEQREMEIHRLSITPDGDTAMIGDDWSTMSFSGEILKDSEGHPDSPYMTFILPE